MAGANDDNPTRIFIVGCARSGTTWMTGIYKASGRAMTTTESHIFPTLFHVLARDYEQPGARAGAVLARFDERAELAPARGFTGPQAWVDRDQLEALLVAADDAQLTGGSAARLVISGIFDAFTEAQRRHHDDFLLEKTPAHLRFADRILRWWPDAKIIEMVRDGRDVCASTGHKIADAGWPATDVAARAQRWVDAIRDGQRLRSLPVAQDRWLTVRYEDLSHDVSTQIRRIHAFTGLPTDDATIDRTVAESSLGAMQQQVLDEPDPVIRRLRGDITTHLRKGSVGGWREDFTDDDRTAFDRVAGPVMAELGYTS